MIEQPTTARTEARDPDHARLRDGPAAAIPPFVVALLCAMALTLMLG